jgi:hypothetical protein
MVSGYIVRKGVGKDLAYAEVHIQQLLSMPSCASIQIVHMDPVGPLPASSEGHMYLLTSINRTLGWWNPYHIAKWRLAPH